MSTYIDSFIIFILCILLYPADQWDALHITGILFLFAFYCFMIVIQQQKAQGILSILTLCLTLFIPETAVFLPFMCYAHFYRRQYSFSALYIIPTILYLSEHSPHANVLFSALSVLSFYLAYQSSRLTALQKDIHSFRDSSVENEMMLKEKNRHLLETQDDKIYIATLQERNRIAREIHDNVGHMLSRSILQVGALLAICKDETIKPHLSTLKETLDTAMDSIRNSVHDLHDESVDLQHALKNLTDNFTFCQATLDYAVSKNVPKEIKYCFLAIAKEALNNTMKHSNASLVKITVKEHPAFYQLLIEDNGTTMHTTTDTTGIGLSNMKERVDTLHGIIHIKTEQGYHIFVSVPK